jgi:hypothetical protein
MAITRYWEASVSVQLFQDRGAPLGDFSAHHMAMKDRMPPGANSTSG